MPSFLSMPIRWSRPALCAVMAASVHASPPMASMTDPCAVYAMATKLGIIAQSLVLADVDVTIASGVLTTIESAEELREAICSAMTAVAQAKQDAVTAAAALSETPDDPGLLLAYQTATSTIATGEAQIASLQMQLLTLVVAELTPEQQAVIENWRLSFHYGAPTEFSIESRSDEEWQAIAIALRAEALADVMDHPLAPTYAQLLEAVRTDPAVMAAELRLSTELPAMIVAFEASLAQ